MISLLLWFWLFSVCSSDFSSCQSISRFLVPGLFPIPFLDSFFVKILLLFLGFSFLRFYIFILHSFFSDFSLEIPFFAISVLRISCLKDFSRDSPFRNSLYSYLFSQVSLFRDFLCRDSYFRNLYSRDSCSRVWPFPLFSFS